MYLSLKTYNLALLQTHSQTFISFLQKKDIKYRIITLPRRTTHYSVIRSPHIFNKSHEKFTKTTYKQCFIINEKVDSISEYFKVYTNPGVTIELVNKYKHAQY